MKKVTKRSTPKIEKYEGQDYDTVILALDIMNQIVEDLAKRISQLEQTKQCQCGGGCCSK